MLLFRGARSTPSRLALFESDALAESNLTDFSFTDVDEELDGAEGDVRTVFGGDTCAFLVPGPSGTTLYWNCFVFTDHHRGWGANWRRLP